MQKEKGRNPVQLAVDAIEKHPDAGQSDRAHRHERPHHAPQKVSACPCEKENVRGGAMKTTDEKAERDRKNKDAEHEDRYGDAVGVPRVVTTHEPDAEMSGNDQRCDEDEKTERPCNSPTLGRRTKPSHSAFIHR